VLLDAGADPDSHAKRGSTVLHMATAEGHDQSVAIHNDTPLQQWLQFFPGETIPQAELLEANDAPSGHGISFWQAISDGDLDRVKAYEEAGMNLEVAEPPSEGNNRNLSPLLQAINSNQTVIAKYLIEQSSNLFGEYNLMKEVRSNGLDEIAEILDTKFRLSYRVMDDEFYIFYGGFDDTAPYYLEGSADLKNWIEVGGSQQSFEHRQECTYNVNVPKYMETRHFFRLRKAE